MDNALAHSEVKLGFKDEQFAEATLLHLGLYSPMLNPIENVFSAIKASVKRFLPQRRSKILAVPSNSTIKAHRTRFLEMTAD